ncbi:MAG: hypothetical protein ABI255_06345 [Microbacteriaceae bacterium]
MVTLRIEHPISDFSVWKAAFDRDPANRKASGVRQYAISQPFDDAHYVLIDLDFETVAQAEGLRSAMQRVWASGAAAPALAGVPRTQILESKEVTQL